MAFSGAQKTRHGVYGGARQLYGSFAGKTPTEAVPVTTVPNIGFRQNVGKMIGGGKF